MSGSGITSVASTAIAPIHLEVVDFICEASAAREVSVAPVIVSLVFNEFLLGVDVESTSSPSVNGGDIYSMEDIRGSGRYLNNSAEDSTILDTAVGRPYPLNR